MPRPHEIAADARALYGPLARRPSAQEAGDGALWVDPSAQQPLTQVQSGNWVSLAPTGVPVLRGPYVVDYTDIPHDGDTKTLWTPRLGDVLLRLFPDFRTATHWDSGGLFIGQDVDGTVDPSHNAITWVPAGASIEDLDNLILFNATDSAGTIHVATAYVFTSTDPVQIQLAQTGGTDPGAGRVELYALIARAVAP